MTSENDLLRHARAFDRQALAEIYDLYSPGLFRYAYRLLGEVDQAEDCVSETFSRFLRTLKSGGGPRQNLKAYLYRVAHNWITDQYRRQPPPPLPLKVDLVAESHNNPVQSADENLERERIRAAIVLLTEDQRQVIILKYLEGFSNQEVAVTLNKPVGAVKSLQHRAIASLRRILISEDESNEA